MQAGSSFIPIALDPFACVINCLFFDGQDHAMQLALPKMCSCNSSWGQMNNLIEQYSIDQCLCLYKNSMADQLKIIMFLDCHMELLLQRYMQEHLRFPYRY